MEGVRHLSFSATVIMEGVRDLSLSATDFCLINSKHTLKSRDCLVALSGEIHMNWNLCLHEKGNLSKISEA